VTNFAQWSSHRRFMTAFVIVLVLFRLIYHR